MNRERWEVVEGLYHAALEREPGLRKAFLDEACGDDAELHREVTELIAYDDPEASFIQSPAIQIAAKAFIETPPPESQTKRFSPPASSQIGVYQLIELLGRGGMGEVYLALDTRLGRKVAVKLLPAEFTTDALRLQRFAHEARAASALNHPNIITIHEIGEAPTAKARMYFIVTEYVEGETLRQRVTRAREKEINARPNFAEVVEIASQVAAALDAAHTAGITHRDIKPDNIMVRHDGIVKVLDFGLAKLTEPPEQTTDVVVSTQSGIVMGTPRYMSPEQARGESADGRTDIFSLGVLLYEMITGRAPFTGATTSDVIASILKDEVEPLTVHDPDVPSELERIVSKTLSKDRKDRYQTAHALLTDLKQFQRDLEFAAEEKKRSSGSRVGNKNRSKALPAALIALAALLVTAVAGWFYFKRSPVPTSKHTVLVADFENKTSEVIFDGTLKQGLAMQLEQSPFLNLFPEARVRQTLRLMGRPPDERITAEVAREICVREGIEALISGSIAPLGNHYVITLEAVNGLTGDTLAREQVEAENKEQVLRRLSHATTQLRERLGESLSSIQQFNRVLEDATTSNLEAFKLHSRAVALAVSGRELEAIPFEKRAVELDPNFAYAWSILSITHFGTGRPGLASDYATKAYALRDHVSEFEQFRLAHRYHYLVTGDVKKAIEALVLQKQMYPRISTGSSDLAFVYYWTGQSDQAIAEARESFELYPDFFAPRLYLGLALLRLNRFTEAKEVLARSIDQNIVHPNMHSALYQLAYIDGEATGMQQQIEWAKGRPDEYLALDWQTGAAAFAGQRRRAQELASRAIELAARGDTQEVAARYATEQALRSAVFGDCRQARSGVAQGLKLARGRLSLPGAALTFALCGESSQTKMLLDELAQRFPTDTLINELWLPVVQAAVELQRGNPAQVIVELKPTSRYEEAAEFWPQYLRGQAYLKLEGRAEAAAEFQKILDHRGYAPLSPLYPLAQLGIARATHNRKAYDEFLAMWRDADEDLPLFLTARKEAEQK